MNRSRYVPFERNRYFYGKLLTVRDFMTEQTYNADKRRLVNRLLYGSGVVAGLQVVAVDDKSIAIETGVALDALGREIVVPSPITMKLSNVDGFTNHDYAKNVYLCVAYDEKPKEPVHAVGGMSNSEEISEHNRIQESYRLFVTDKRPKQANISFEHLMFNEWAWYDDGAVSIYQHTPRYIERDEEFEITFVIEKTLQSPPVAFEFIPQFSALTIVDGDVDGKIVFQEPIDSGETQFVKHIKLKLDSEAQESLDQTEKLLSLSVASGSVKLTIGDRVVYDLNTLKQKVEIVEQDVASKIINEYYNRPLDHALDAPSEPSIYLAQLNLLQMGSSYVIDKVVPQPFEDYVMNPTLLYKLIKHKFIAATSEGSKPQLAEVIPLEQLAKPQPFPHIEEEFARIMPEIEEYEPTPTVTTGIAEISIVPAQKKKWYQSREKVFYSEEIEHGFADSVPYITTAISDEDIQSDVAVPEMWKKSNALLSGDQSILKGSEFELHYPKLTIAIIQFPAKQTFRIAVKVHKKTDIMRVRVRWWATGAVAVKAEELPLEAHLQAAATSE